MTGKVPRAIVLLIAAVFTPLPVYGSPDSADFRPETYQEFYTELLSAFVPGLGSRAGGDRAVADFCRSIEARGGSDADSITIATDEYWTSFFLMGWNDPSVYYVRIFLLMEEARLEQAINTLSFAVEPARLSDSDWNWDVVEGVWTDVMEQFEYYDNIWSQGVMMHDLQMYDWALERYDTVLSMNPTYVPALVSKGVTLAVMEEQKVEGGSIEKARELMAKARKANPFYSEAYQGSQDDDDVLSRIVEEDLFPVLGELRSGNTAELDLVEFAKLCARIQASEYAVYALWIDIGRRISAGQPIDEHRELVSSILENAGFETALSVFLEILENKSENDS